MSSRNTLFFTLAAVLSLLSACSPQPEAPAPETCREMTPQLTAAGPQALLSFPLEPDTLTAQCWPESAWGDEYAQGEAAAVEGDALTLNPGSWIYEVRAGWDRMPDFEGTSSYTVFICME